MKKMKLSEVKKGTILYVIASAMIKEHGFYVCELAGETVEITS